jgi:hypothetical protein
LSVQPRDTTPRKSDTRPDSAAIKVLDRYRFKFHQLAQQESDSVVKQMLGNLIALCKKLADVDRDCRKEWQSEGKIFAPEFIREVLLPNALVTISEHERTLWRKERPKWLDIRDWLHLGHRFDAEIRPLKDDLEKAYKGEADEPVKQESQPRPSDAMSAAEAKNEQRNVREKSHFTRAVEKALIRAPKATGIEISLSVDEDGVEPSPAMRTANVRSYEVAYQRRIGNLDSRYTKIRRTMRESRLL